MREAIASDPDYVRASALANRRTPSRVSLTQV
jgi:hypothetical protein